jgi:hypothetical protein
MISFASPLWSIMPHASCNHTSLSLFWSDGLMDDGSHLSLSFLILLVCQTGFVIVTFLSPFPERAGGNVSGVEYCLEVKIASSSWGGRMHNHATNSMHNHARNDSTQENE